MLIITLILTLTANAGNIDKATTKDLNKLKPITKVEQPKCHSTKQSCLDAWYKYGDETGDYGPIDAAK